MFIIGSLKGGNTAEDVAFVIRCLSPAVLLIPFLSITKGFLQGHKYISASSMSQLIEQIVRIFVILAGSFLAYKVFKGTLSLAVGIAVSGAFFGGLAAYLYLKRVINKNNLLKESRTKDNISNRDITKKIIIYAIPFVIISVINSLYNETDQILVLRLLEYLKFDAKEVENIAAAIATWSPKICIIINAMAMGMTMSLVPTIVSSFAKKDHKDVERQINKTLSMIVFVSLPLSIGISVLSNSIWTLFYTPSEIGGTILRLMAFSALLGNLVMIVSTLCQSVNKYHAVYIVAILGLVLNAGLDIPIMILYNKIGLPTYLGSITATMIGYSISILIGLLILRKENKYSYTNAFKNILKSLIPGLSMLFVLVLVNHFLPFDAFSKKTAVFNIIIDVIIGAPIYIGLSLKLGLIDEILGRTMFNKLIRKITFGKINLKDA
jgi:O-antigen/teichoic acid export membrane protein